MLNVKDKVRSKGQNRQLRTLSCMIRRITCWRCKIESLITRRSYKTQVIRPAGETSRNGTLAQYSAVLHNIDKWTGLKLKPVVIDSLNRILPPGNKPNYFQAAIIGCLNMGFAVSARAPPGAGKSLAALVYALSQTRLPTMYPGLTNLIIVPTPQLAMQYLEKVRQLVNPETKQGFPMEKVCQILYRSDQDIEDKQQAVLSENNDPHILVTTPTRLLDIFASESRDSVNLAACRTIIVDEADIILDILPDNPGPEVLRKRALHTPPGVTLIDHVLRVRRFQQDQQNLAYFPPSMAFMSSRLNKRLKDFVVDKQWSTEKQLFRVGMKREDFTTQASISQDVDCYIVAWDKDRQEPKDVKDFDFPTSDAEMGSRLSFDNSKIEELRARPPAYTSLPPDEVLNCVKAIWNQDGKTPGLIVVPEYMSKSKLQKQFQEDGIKAATFMDLESDGTICKDFNGENVKFWNLFDKKSQQCPIDFLICSLPELRGLEFSGLSRTYLLCWQSCMFAKDFMTLSGLCRPNTQVTGERGRVITITEDDPEALPILTSNLYKLGKSPKLLYTA